MLTYAETVFFHDSASVTSGLSNMDLIKFHLLSTRGRVTADKSIASRDIYVGTSVLLGHQ